MKENSSVEDPSTLIDMEECKDEDLGVTDDKSTVNPTSVESEEQDEDAAVVVEEEEAGDEEEDTVEEAAEEQFLLENSGTSSNQVVAESDTKSADISSESTSDCVVLDSAAGDAEVPESEDSKMLSSSKGKAKEGAKSSDVITVKRDAKPSPKTISKTVKKIVTSIKRTSMRKTAAAAATKKESGVLAARRKLNIGVADGVKKAAAGKGAKKSSTTASEEPKQSSKSPSKDAGNEATKTESNSAAKSTEEKKEEDKKVSVENKKSDVKEISGEKIKRFTASDKTVWVSSISSKTRAADLKSLFSKHGKVSTAKILTNSKTPGARCYGLVTMQSEKDAAACIKHLHRTELHGRVISVEKTRLSLKKPATPVKAQTKPSEGKTSEKKEKEPEKKEGNAEKVKDSEKSGHDSSKVIPTSRTSSTSRHRSSSKSRTEKGNSSKRSEKSADRFDRNRRDRRSRSLSVRDRFRNNNNINNNRFDFKDNTQRPWHNRNLSRSPLRANNQPFRDRYGNVVKRSETYISRYSPPRLDMRDRFEDREMERKNRIETRRLERERERLREERDELERERARVLRMEKEHQRLERQKLEVEMEQLRKYSLKLDMTDSRTSKRSSERQQVWDDRKRSRLNDHSTSGSMNSNDRDRRDGRQDGNVGRFYDNSSRRQPFHGSSSSDNLDNSSWNHQSTQDQGKYGSSGMPVMPGIWARMDVPPPPIQQQSQQRWTAMDQQHMSHPNTMGHQPPSNPMAPNPNQVVMFVGSNPNNGSGGPVQYPGNRYGSDNMRRY